MLRGIMGDNTRDIILHSSKSFTTNTQQLRQTTNPWDALLISVITVKTRFFLNETFASRI